MTGIHEAWTLLWFSYFYWICSFVDAGVRQHSIITDKQKTGFWKNLIRFKYREVTGISQTIAPILNGYIYQEMFQSNIQYQID